MVVKESFMVSKTVPSVARPVAKTGIKLLELVVPNPTKSSVDSVGENGLIKPVSPASEPSTAYLWTKNFISEKFSPRPLPTIIGRFVASNVRRASLISIRLLVSFIQFSVPSWLYEIRKNPSSTHSPRCFPPT
ncbi:hypothetical protein D3C86_1402930 [compost metagenome]